MSSRSREFVGVDGEGVNVAGRHEYLLLCVGDRVLHNKGRPLRTWECLEHLLETAGDGRLYVGFAFGYDVNMILRDVDRDALARLWKEGETTYRAPDGTEYLLHYRPTKWFQVARIKDFERVGDRWRPRCDPGFRVSDLFGFCEQSFVKTLRNWQVCTDEEVTQVEVGKANRELFHVKQLPSITDYCKLECRLIGDLGEKIRQCTKGAGIQTLGWYGPGALSGGWLKQINFKRALDTSGIMSDLERRAYFGGRTEIYRQGPLDNAHCIDLRSAYPWSMVDLPTMASGRWFETIEMSPYALYYVKWKAGNDCLAPFPVRVGTDARIVYQREGEGWYHSIEVQAAIRCGFDLSIERGWAFEPATDERPLAGLAELYERRVEYQKAKDPRQFVLKLMLNSVYGKLCQSQGYQGAEPVNRSIYLAGRVTADIRARLLQVLSVNRDQLVAVATDGILTTGKPRGVQFCDLLGGWRDEGEIGPCISVAPGVVIAADGGSYTRTRGFRARSVKYNDLMLAWERDGPLGQVEIKTRSFAGLGNVIQSGRWSERNQWIEDKRVLAFTCSPDRVPIGGGRMGFGVLRDDYCAFGTEEEEPGWRME